MARYVATPAPRADWADEDYPLLPNLVVDGREAFDTGLVTERGVPIMRLPNPIGFGRDREW